MSTLDSLSLISPSQFPRGSEWRNWDLHVHTPESKLGASFVDVDWVNYIEGLENAALKAKISVIGVTDYMSIDGYVRLLNEKSANGKLPDIDLLIPNIEFRMMPSTADGKALNLHLLVDPSEPDHVARITRSLKNLKYEYHGEIYGCERTELIEFARAQRADLVSDDAAYKYGISQFKPGFNKIKDWLEKEAWLRRNCLIGIANGKDGISGLPLDGFGATRDEILHLCDFVFSGNPSDRKHYLGLKQGIPPEEIIRQYRSLKPCVHGSDAHDLDSLFSPDHDRFCWIKSDPTFHGLRQILWEPEERIHIGKIPPQPSDQSQLISSITLSNTHGWFDGDTIELNPGLVTIIGEKGAGKTAIADLTAFAAGVSLDPKSQSSFITKGKLHLSGTKVCLKWANGDTTEATLTDQPFIATRPRVRYLSQDFVERLCSSDHEGTELQRAIEDVVFARLDEVQKEGYSSFDELRNAREGTSNIRREGLRGELATLHKEVERLQQSIDQRGLKAQSKVEAEKQVAELKKQLPEATQFMDQEVLEKLESMQTLQKKIEEEISNRVRRRRIIEGASESYTSLKQRVATEVRDIERDLTGANVAKEAIEKLSPQWNQEVDGLLLKEIDIIDQEIAKRKGTEEDTDGTQSLLAVQKDITKLKELVSKDEVSRKRLLDLQKQIAKKTATTERLAKEIEGIDTRVSKKLKQKQQQQIELYLKVFEALNEDEKGLNDLYAPMQDAIEKLGTEMQFNISVGYQIDFKSWFAQFSRFCDGRRTGADRKRTEIERLVETKLVPAWKGGAVADINKAFLEFQSVVDAKTFSAKYGMSNHSLVELYDWMFSVDHIRLTYKVRYAGTELEYLSPGSRGIALLVLYLLMDEDDTRPLLIDQPEGNLDNSSVFTQLVPYITKAKTRRQIILITHNPNLVVATDAEQVVVATAERPSSQPYPRIKYHSGALEHTSDNDALGMQEAVCLLLEGGKEAFCVRENRYAFTQ